MNIGIFNKIKHLFFSNSGKYCFFRLNNWHLLYLLYIPASSAQSLDTPINMQLNNVSMADAIKHVAEQSGYQINYNQNIFPQKGNIKMQVSNQPVKQVLTDLFHGKQVAFKETDKKTIVLFQNATQQEHGRLSGKIMDDNGHAMQGASIRIGKRNIATQTDYNGDFSLNLPVGIYDVEVSYVAYKTQQITDVRIAQGGSTPMIIALSPLANTLEQVIVVSTYKNSNISGLLVKQKNASEISNGISAEQILKTPDLHIGESLKRISGLNSIDNKFVIVRGIGERYNAAMLDGTVLPSTEANSRQFSFDLIPSDLVDNIIVSKTLTPDMNASFAGGLIQINTKDIPTENFTSLTIGSYYNDQSTGKDFFSHKRGKYDFLGFDDGRRSLPSDLQHTDRTTAPNHELTDDAFIDMVVEQSKKFKHDNFSVYRYKAAPAQNYQFTMGRLYPLNEQATRKFGFTAALSYRNSQQIERISDMYRGRWFHNTDIRDSLQINNQAMNYKFNSNWGAILNAGLQLENHRISSKNTFTQTFNNNLYRITGHDNNLSGADIRNLPPNIEEADRPVFTSLRQHKIAGEHQLQPLKLEWDLALTSIKRMEKDISTALLVPRKIDDTYQYFYGASVNATEPRVRPMSRQSYQNAEQHYTWSLAASLPFTLNKQKNSLKLGYFGQRKKGDFSWVQASLYANSINNPGILYLPIAEMVDPKNMGKDGFQYRIGSMNADKFEGKNQLDAFYAMLDNRLTEKLRLVWGIRAEKFKYTELITPPRSKIIPVKTDSVPDKEWAWLPSANLTYNLTSAINLRAAWSKSIVRPELMDNNEFLIYSPYLGGDLSNFDLQNSAVNSLDFKAEWFPGLGEIVSLGGFYKYFDRPVELTLSYVGGAALFLQKNSDYAKVYGLEFEFRKGLGFISENWLNDLSLFGNLTLQKSTVQASYETMEINKDGTQVFDTKHVKSDRPMYGNAPYIFNAGLQYDAQRLNFNITYNKTGYKTYVIADIPQQMEFEMPRSQLDIQLGYRFLQERLLVKANAANLLNNRTAFYRNSASYTENLTNKDSEAIFKEGFSAKYDKGDNITYKFLSGRTFSVLLTYTF